MGRTANGLQGFRAYLPTESQIPGYTYIGFHSFALVLSKTNQRVAACIECKEKIEAGQGIYHSEHYHNGFLHLNCAKKMIVRYGSVLGFTENVLFNLQSCFFSKGKFTAEQVADAIGRFEPQLEAMPPALALSVKGN